MCFLCAAKGLYGFKFCEHHKREYTDILISFLRFETEGKEEEIRPKSCQQPNIKQSQTHYYNDRLSRFF